jgi:GNAT superfamily N-acetyltransferase
MVKKITIVSTDKPEWGTIGQGISAFNTQQAGEDNGQNLCFILKTPEDEVVGGIIGATHWNWFYINLMWIQKDLRIQGYGSKLLEMAEEEARKRGAEKAYLDTFSFQAPEFYSKHGYKVFGELKDFPPGHKRFYMEKAI